MPSTTHQRHWSAAETQVRSSVGEKSKSTVVNVKSSTQAAGQKRKTVAAASEESKKEMRRSKSRNRRRAVDPLYLARQYLTKVTQNHLTFCTPMTDLN